jgi:hypothetical protein
LPWALAVEKQRALTVKLAEEAAKRGDAASAEEAVFFMRSEPSAAHGRAQPSLAVVPKARPRNGDFKIRGARAIKKRGGSRVWAIPFLYIIVRALVFLNLSLTWCAAGVWTCVLSSVWKPNVPMSRPTFAEFTRWNKRAARATEGAPPGDGWAALGREWQAWYDHTGRHCAHFAGCDASQAAGGGGFCKFGRRNKVHHVLTGPVLDFWAELDDLTKDRDGKAALNVVRVNVKDHSGQPGGGGGGSETPPTRRLVGLEVPERALGVVLAHIAKKGPGSTKPALCDCLYLPPPPPLRILVHRCFWATPSRSLLS